MPQSVSQYVFGNSLVNFSEGGARTNIAVWMDLMAEAAGNGLAFSGGYGFLRDFADRTEPGSEWGFAGVTPSWNSEARSFAAADIDTIIITPANFIQYQAPGANYEGDTRSPLDATLDIIDDALRAHPDARIFIYEGWADMAGFVDGVPARQSALADYHAYNRGDYHDWYLSYVAQLNAARPDADVALIPVAQILSQLMTGPLAGMSPRDLYVDTAPHGTETLYLLAAMATYSAVYGTPPPASLALPGVIHPAVQAAYPDLVGTVHAVVSDAVGDVPPPGGGDPAPDPGPVDPGPGDPTPPDTSAGPAPDSATAAPGGSVLIDVLANDGSGLRLTYVDDAGQGSTRIENGQVRYTAAPGATGQDGFHYTVQNGSGQFFEAYVSVTIGASPPPSQPEPDSPSRPEAGLGPASVMALLQVWETGLYRFDAYADDPVQALLNGDVLDLVQGPVPGDQTAEIYLTAGTHWIEIGYGQPDIASEVMLVVDGPGPVVLGYVADASDLPG